MLESGTVTQVNGQYAKVMIERKEACGNCNACGLMRGTVQNVFIDVKNTLGAQVGDRIELSFSTKTSLLSTAIVYLIPLILLIIGIALGYTVFADLLRTEKEPTAAISGLIFAVLSFGIVKIFDPMIKKRSQFEMRSILRKGE